MTPARDTPRAAPGRDVAAALAAAVLSQIALSMIQQGIPAIEPALRRSFAVPLPVLGGLATAVSLGSAAALILVGRLVDVWGARRVMAIGSLVASLVLAAVAFSRTVGAIEAGLIVFGIVAAVIPTGGVTAVFRTAPRARRGLALGVRQASVSVGGAIAALLFPRLGLHYGWQGAFVVVAGVLVAAALVALAMPPDPPRPAVSAAGRRIRARTPMRLVSAAFLLGIAQWTTLAFLGLFMARRLHLSDIDALQFLAIGQITSLFARVGWGYVSDRWLGGARQPLLKFIAAVVVANSLVLTLVNPGWPRWAADLVAAVAGISVLSWNGLMATLAVETVPGDPGRATGQIIMAIFLGGAVGAPLIGFLENSLGTLTVGWMATAASAAGAYAFLTRRLAPAVR